MKAISVRRLKKNLIAVFDDIPSEKFILDWQNWKRVQWRLAAQMARKMLSSLSNDNNVSVCKGGYNL